jgi:D-threonate/D-erythronate kinase
VRSSWPPMKQIAIIADDLTSACDGAAPFRAAGCPAYVVFDPPRRGPLPSGVTAVDTDSRSKSAAPAARRAAAATLALAAADVLFKTVDSTLRGHIATEIDAVLAVSSKRTAVLAPAFPAQGRTTEHGVQHLAGQPVDRTWFAQDPGHPVRCADLLFLFPGAVPVIPGHAPAGGGKLAELARRIDAARYAVADATSDTDLDQLTAAVPIGQVLWAGSPGLAAALARRLGPREPAPMQNVSARRVLFVIGSLHPASQEQLAWICSARAATAVSVLNGEAAERAEQRLARQAAVVLHGPTDQAAAGLPVPAMLAEVTARLAEARAFDALVITGGETARTVLLACGARGLELAGELEPGIPLGFADCPRRLPVVVKAGGFGDHRLLARLLARLRDPMATASHGRLACSL